MRTRCSQNQPCFNDFSGPDTRGDGLWLIWHQFSKAYSAVQCRMPWMPKQPGPLFRCLAAKPSCWALQSVLGTALGSVSRQQHRLKWLHSEDFLPKHHFTHNNDNKPYGLQKPTNSRQFTTPEILLLSTLSIQAVLAGATHSAVTLCDI